MKRLQLLEIHEQPWCPRLIRDAVTDYLQIATEMGRVYHPVAGKLARALKRSGAARVLDLCSGGGGPWGQLASVLEQSGHATEVWLSDLYPNAAAFARAAARQPGLHAVSEPVDAMNVPSDLGDFRTLFSSFHHFPPPRARALLQDAVSKGQGIGVFEATRRHPQTLLAMLLTPLMVLVLTPRLRPCLSRLLLTYLLPLIPLVVFVDGIVSCLRTYTPAELEALCTGLEDYLWETGELGGSPLPVVYLIGTPRETRPV